jgi:hypothetical protein
VGISAALLFVLMFFHWFGVRATNTSNLLFAIQSVEPDKNAWEALEYIPIVLVTTIGVGVLLLALRFMNVAHRWHAPLKRLVLIAGLVSTFLIAFRIIEPPVFGTEETVTYEGIIQLPIFFAFLAALGVVHGAYRASRETDTVGKLDDTQ